MGDFDRAVAAMRDAERRCPACKEMNVPGATPTITRQQDGSYHCDNCSKSWRERP